MQNGKVSKKNFLLLLLAIPLWIHFMTTSMIHLETWTDTDDEDYVEKLNSLSKLTGNIPVGSLNCTEPLVPFYDRIITERCKVTKKCKTQKIPPILHLTFISRCLPQDIAATLQLWSKAFPNYSIFFHDDQAVENLLNEEWSEFPNLHQAIKCIKYKGAMVSDLWRMLVVYKYGGFYTDVDNVPFPIMNEAAIQNKYSGFFFTDVGKIRPLQNLFAMEPGHPIAYFTVLQILENLFQLSDISKPNIRQVTGPIPMNSGFLEFLYQELTFQSAQTDQNYFGLHKKVIRKICRDNTRYYVNVKLGYGDIVSHPFNETLKITKAERIEIESGSYHWEKALAIENKDIFIGTCKEYLATVR